MSKSLFGDIFGPSASEIESDRQAALVQGYKKGWEDCRDRISTMMEEKGQGKTAIEIRKMELVKKGKR